MSRTITVGLDLAKNVFQAHGADTRGAAVLPKKLRRAEVLNFFANLPSCLVAMEACDGAHFWGREIGKLGHERMNRTIKEATLKRFHYECHEQLRAHFTEFIAAYNFARRLKTLGDLTPYEYICKVWTSETDSFILNPIHQMPGLST